jgi:hypothetical protein
MGRVLSVFTPVQQLAQIAGALASGWLATALVGMSVDAGPVTLGRLDTILGAGAILLIAGAIFASFTVREKPTTSQREKEREAPPASRDGEAADSKATDSTAASASGPEQP